MYLHYTLDTQSEQYACAIFARFERLQWDLSNYNSQLVIGKTGRHADSQSVGWRCCSTLLRLQRLTICLDRETGEYSGAEESNLVKLYWQEATAKNARHRRLGKEQKCSKCLCSLPRESEGEEALDAIWLEMSKTRARQLQKTLGAKMMMSMWMSMQ